MSVELKVDYVDHVMDCCGLGEGSGFIKKVETGKKVEQFRMRRNLAGLVERQPTGYFNDELREPTVEDQVQRLRWLWTHATEYSGRSACLITLAEGQSAAIAAAKKEGWELAYEFYNTNSGNQVYVYAKKRFSSRAEMTNDDDQEEDF